MIRWDYGYQISQIANRTTLADGNTWNHEHIALLGKMLVSTCDSACVTERVRLVTERVGESVGERVGERVSERVGERAGE